MMASGLIYATQSLACRRRCCSMATRLSVIYETTILCCLIGSRHCIRFELLFVFHNHPHLCACVFPQLWYLSSCTGFCSTAHCYVIRLASLVHLHQCLMRCIVIFVVTDVDYVSQSEGAAVFNVPNELNLHNTIQCRLWWRWNEFACATNAACCDWGVPTYDGATSNCDPAVK